MTALLVPAWLVLGAAAGYGARLLNVRLAPTEGLQAGRERWQVWGPPALCALLFGLLALLTGPQWRLLLVDSLWVAVLVQVIFFDLEHHLILDVVLGPSALAALALAWLAPPPDLRSSLAGGVAGLLLFLLVALLGSLLTRQEAMGFGDVKLVAFLGLVLGLWRRQEGSYVSPLFSAILVGVVLGGVVSLLIVVLRLRKLRDMIAYGPFLALGALVVLFQSAAH